MLQDLLRRLKQLEDRSVKHRIGVVTDTDPLSVALGGSDVPHTSVRCLYAGPIEEDDVVSCLTFGRDLIVLGKIASAPAVEAPKIVWGVVNANGTIAGGSGDFSVTKNGTGDYTITFSPAFGAVPAVTESIEFAATTAALIQHRTPTTSGVSFYTTTNAGYTLSDQKFAFHAIGSA